MKTIMLEVDEVTGNAYENIAPETKEQFITEATTLLKQLLADARSVKLKKIIEDIRNEGNMEGLNSEIIAELLRTEL
jgi:phosphoribosylformimino-5-aminoimidazole carboxamide ribonucleotide (ProFAR) isomerase